MSIVTTVTLVLHVPTTYYFVEWFGFAGAPLALGVNAWLVFFLLLAYTRLNPKTRQCWPDRFEASTDDFILLLKMGSGGAASMMGVWWAWELLRY